LILHSIYTRENEDLSWPYIGISRAVGKSLSLHGMDAVLMKEATSHAQKDLRQWMKNDSIKIALVETPGNKTLH